VSVRVTDATPEDVKAYFGESIRETIKAVSLWLDDELMGIAGFVRYNGHMKAFSDVKEEFVPYLRKFVVLRKIIEMKKYCEKQMIPVYGVSGDTYGPGLLENMGFVEIQENVYRWVN